MTQRKTIACLAGDGIGPELITQTRRVLDAIATRFNYTWDYQPALIGGAAYLETGQHFPDATREICERSDAILFGAVGGPVSEQHQPQWQRCEANSILALRNTFQFNVNIRPIYCIPALAALSPLRHLGNAPIDIMIFRELVGGIYFGQHEQTIQNGQRIARDEAVYSEAQIAAVARQAFSAAARRRGQLTSVDKANVLATSKLWRHVVDEIAPEFPTVTVQHLLVDNCAMQLVINPGQFDVIVTSNLFGDILSDVAAVIPGSLGMVPSASLNEAGFGLYEPAGGSAPALAGKNIANPCAQFLSAAMMLRYAFQDEAAAQALTQAINTVISQGIRTADLIQAHDDNSTFTTPVSSDTAMTLTGDSAFTTPVSSDTFAMPINGSSVTTRVSTSVFTDTVIEALLAPEFVPELD